MRDAAARIVRRVGETAEESAGRFPIYGDPVSGAWTWSDDGGWFGGFWPGLLWLAAAATGERRYAQTAAQAAERLLARMHAPTVLRGFLFWYGAGLSIELGHGNDRAVWCAAEAARSMAADFDQNAGLLPPGEEDAAEYGWPRPGACIDALPCTVPLLVLASEHAGDPALRTMAESHARGLHRLCVRADGSVAQSATYDPAGALLCQASLEGSAPDSTWSRAQAWAMLGLAQAAHRWPGLTPAASRVADWYLLHVPDDLVCYWDFDDPAIPDAARDTSATAIAAAALAKLAPLGGSHYREAAAATLAALSDNHLNDHGGLIHGCYDQRNGLATSNELIWGDYYLLETALALDGTINTARL